MSKAITGFARSREQAERAVNDLETAGFSPDEISVLFPDVAGSRDFGHERSSKAPEGAAAGGSAGGVVGGAVGLLAGVGALAIPGLGPFIAAGPLLAALSGAAVGAAVGGVTGALVGLGIPEYEAKRYEGKLREGNYLISVHADSHEEQQAAKRIFKRDGLDGVAETAEATV